MGAYRVATEHSPRQRMSSQDPASPKFAAYKKCDDNSEQDRSCTKHRLPTGLSKLGQNVEGEYLVILL